MKKYRLETRAVHAGQRPDPGTGAIAPGITFSTTFLRETDGSYPSGYSYGRAANPNRERLEEKLASLEGGMAAVAFSSGTAATLAVFSLLKGGDEILACRDSYHGTLQQLDDIVSRWGVVIRQVDTTDLDVVRNSIGPNSRLLWVETPTNPLLRLCDIAGLAELARDHNLILAWTDHQHLDPRRRAHRRDFPHHQRLRRTARDPRGQHVPDDRLGQLVGMQRHVVGGGMRPTT